MNIKSNLSSTIIASIIFISNVHANPQIDYKEDAFGLYWEEDDKRALWAGNRYICNINSSCKAQYISPEEPQSIAFFIGEKNLLSREENGLAFALLEDDFGNLVEDGLEVFIVEEESLPPTKRYTKNGIAEKEFSVPPVSAIYQGWAYYKNLQSARHFYRSLPNTKNTQFDIQTNKQVFLQGENLDIRTSKLSVYGEELHDVSELGYLIARNQYNQHMWMPIYFGNTHHVAAHKMKGNYVGKIYNRHDHDENINIKFSPVTLIAPAKVELLRLDDDGLTQISLWGFPTSLGHIIADGSEIKTHIIKQSGNIYSKIEYVLDDSVTFNVNLEDADYPAKLLVESEFGSYELTLDKSDISFVP